MATNTLPSHFSCFMDLPAELRIQIYQDVFNDCHFTVSHAKGKCDVSVSRPMLLLSANRQIRYDALPSFFASATLVLTGEGTEPNLPTVFAELYLANIRRVDIDLDFWNDRVPCRPLPNRLLVDADEFANLRRVDVHGVSTLITKDLTDDRLVELSLYITMDNRDLPLVNGLKYYETRRFSDQGPESTAFAKRRIQLFLHVQFVIHRRDIGFCSAINAVINVDARAVVLKVQKYCLCKTTDRCKHDRFWGSKETAQAREEAAWRLQEGAGRVPADGPAKGSPPG